MGRHRGSSSSATAAAAAAARHDAGGPRPACSCEPCGRCPEGLGPAASSAAAAPGPCTVRERLALRLACGWGLNQRAPFLLEHLEETGCKVPGQPGCCWERMGE